MNTRRTSIPYAEAIIFSLMLLLSACSSSGNDETLTETEISQGQFINVCDDMVYSIDFGSDYPELKQAAMDGKAEYWLEDYDGDRFELSQNSVSNGRAVLRIDGEMEAGVYRLMMDVDDEEGSYEIDKVVEIRAPHIISYEGQASPGGTIELTGSHFGKSQSVYLAYRDTLENEKKYVPCTVVEGDDGFDDPYDETDEEFPMDVSSGESRLKVILPEAASSWIDPWLMIESDNGRGMISLESNETELAEGSEDKLKGEDESRNGRIFSISQRCSFYIEEGLIPIIKKIKRSMFNHPVYENMINVISKDEVIGSWFVKYMANQSDFEEGCMNYDITLFDIQYLSRDVNGNEVKSSGVLILPWLTEQDKARNTISKPILSFQHGTILTKKGAPSMSWGHDLAYAALFAATGYITVVSDMPGMGIASVNSNDIHTYCQAKPIAYACADMLKGLTYSNFNDEFYQNDKWVSAKEFKGFYRPDGLVSMTGYSEGGYATMALFKEFSQHASDYRGLNVIAVAAQSGPYSVSDVMRKKLMEDTKFPIFYFAPYLIVTLNKTTDLNYTADELLAPGYTELYSIVDGTHSDTDIDKYRPPSRKPREIFQETIRGQMDAGTGKFYEKLKENDLDSGWTMSPSTKVMLVHSSDDDCVPYDNALKMKQNYPGIELHRMYEDFSTSRLGSGLMGETRTKHELYFIYCMGRAWSWLRKVQQGGSGAW
jgi:pimeloyl-ACP methyl ester carboxylesterase